MAMKVVSKGNPRGNTFSIPLTFALNFQNHCPSQALTVSFNSEGPAKQEIDLFVVDSNSLLTDAGLDGALKSKAIVTSNAVSAVKVFTTIKKRAIENPQYERLLWLPLFVMDKQFFA